MTKLISNRAFNFSERNKNKLISVGNINRS